MKKNRLFYKTVILLVFSGLFYGCEYPVGEIRIDQETKDYCLFEQGSCWIYQDSTSVTIDSVVIDKPISYSFSRSDWNGAKCEQYSSNISYASHDSSTSIHVILTTGFADSESQKPGVLILDFVDNPIYHNGEVGETVPLYQDIILLERTTNYSINNVNYSNVKIFERNYYEKKKIYYWAKHVGLIREEIYENDTLISVRNLIRYNVQSSKIQKSNS